MENKTSLVKWLLLLLIAVQTGAFWNTRTRGIGIDFYQFWLPARYFAAVDSNQSIYTQEFRTQAGQWGVERAAQSDSEMFSKVAEFRKVLQTMGSPFLYAITGAIFPFSYETALLCFRILSVFCLLFAFWRMAVFWSLSTELILLILFCILYWFEPAYSDFRVGNLALIQLAFLIGFTEVYSRAATQRAQITTGVLLAALVLFKQNLLFIPLILIFWEVFNKNYKKLTHLGLGFASGVLGCALFSLFILHSFSSWLDWINIFGKEDVFSFSSDVTSGNFSLYTVFAATVGGAWFIPCAIALAAGSLFLCVKLAKARPDQGPTIAICLSPLLFIAFSPLAWIHYYVLLLPLLVYLFTQAHRSWIKVVALVPLVLISRNPLGIFFDTLPITTEAWLYAGSLLILFNLWFFDGLSALKMGTPLPPHSRRMGGTR